MNRTTFHFIFKIHIHPLFWAVAAIAIITARFQELLILFTIVLIHELGHAAAASFFSWRIKTILLLPFGGVAEFDEHGNRSLKEEFWVTLFGPIQHVWMILISYLLVSQSLISEAFHSTWVGYNLMILLFNCLPILPLDGGKMVYLLFCKYYSFIDALKNAIITSLLFLALYIIALLLISPHHLNGWLIAIFLLVSLRLEWKNRSYVFMRFLLGKHSNLSESSPTEMMTCQSKETIQAVVERLKRGQTVRVIVYESGTRIGDLSEDHLLDAYFEGRYHTSLKELFFNVA